MCKPSPISSPDHEATKQLMKQPTAKTTAPSILQDTLAFWQCLLYFLLGGSYAGCTHYAGNIPARVQVYSLTLIAYLWHKPHYRSGTFSCDMRKNLRNVAIPGTGVPLSLLCYFKVAVYPFLFVAYPLICLVAAVNASRKGTESLAAAYQQQLLNPQDWFSFWRLNCRLASFHSLIEKTQGYAMEDKWTFLVEGKKEGIAISPYYEAGEVHDLVIKDKNEEGGMGIFFFKNASAGGNWIIQERLHNNEELSKLLPPNPPLSTLRVISASLASLHGQPAGMTAAQGIKCMSCVFRAGRAGASTDHSSILFDVDMQTGQIRKGTTNAHWYQLGLDKIRSTPWTSSHGYSKHPDADIQVEGEYIHGMEQILSICQEAHFKLLPDVPLAGWDVALTDKGMCLLETNLSCNFFRGKFDQQWYYEYVDAQFRKLDKKRVDEAQLKQA